MPFLGSCEVCQKPVRNYRGLAQHLRFNQDPAHQALRVRWVRWKTGRKKGTQTQQDVGLVHLLGTLQRLETCSRVYRNWWPKEELTY